MSTKNQVLILAERIAKKLVAEQTMARLSLGLDVSNQFFYEVVNRSRINKEVRNDCDIIFIGIIDFLVRNLQSLLQEVVFHHHKVFV